MGDISRKLEEKIKAKDAIKLPPSTRAEIVLNTLKMANDSLSEWDLICFCAEFLGLMSVKYLWMREEAKKINSLVYQAHYLIGDDEDGRDEPVDSTNERGEESKENIPIQFSGIIITRPKT